MNAQLFLNNFDSQFIASVKGTPVTGTPATELDYGIIRVSQAAGAILGTLTSGDYYILTAFKRSGSNESSVEIMKVTSVDTSVINETRLTVLRGQEGTTPQDYVSGDYVSMRETASMLDNMLQKSGNLSGLADNAAARANIGLGNVSNTSDANKPISTAQQAALDAKAPLASPSFTGVVGAPNINGAAASGFKNKIINGCMRISKKGAGVAAVGWNYFGADGIGTFIGGWSAVSGAIGGEYAQTDGKTSSGADHYINVTTATGSSGYISFVAKIEAADSLELAGNPVTASARITALTKQIDNCVIKIIKANAANNFLGGTTVLATSPEQGPISANTTKDVSFSPTLSAADCANGLQIEVICSYGSAVTASFHCFIADLQCCAGSQRMPFELRPIAIEEQLRRRYYQKQSVRVNTSSNWTCFPIGMVKTPTITGGGTGFVSTGTTADTLMCYQTTAAAQTLILDAEL